MSRGELRYGRHPQRSSRRRKGSSGSRGKGFQVGKNRMRGRILNDGRSQEAVKKSLTNTEAGASQAKGWATKETKVAQRGFAATGTDHVGQVGNLRLIVVRPVEGFENQQQADFQSAAGCHPNGAYFSHDRTESVGRLP